MKQVLLVSFALLVGSLGGCGRPPEPTDGIEPPRKVDAPPPSSDDPLEAARALLRVEKARVDGIAPPPGWPEPSAVRRIGNSAWAVDLDTSNMPGGYPQQLVVEVRATGGHTGLATR